ncbi:OmpA family protein [Actibacterium pelagium]|uniref:OmpA-like domain-containing protein n=1 Tax=Actibacterium pelagium TaxID=2029103 RepID=A0A917ELH6_9RHOB|nr:OmpA family protein [Actibacterium pelagium]GGE58737.1 hypothetical protein GCM10011517_27990 [Actibacterium pelagium]
MPIFKHALGLSLTLAMAAVAPVASVAQDASELSAEEIEALFKKQKTRGLVLATPVTNEAATSAGSSIAAGSTAVATPVAPTALATPATPSAPVASTTVTATAPVTAAPAATVASTAPTATPSTSIPTMTAPVVVQPTYVAVEKADQVNVQISFDFDSAALRADQKPKLATLCQVMRNVDVSVFQIVGHTDSSGSASYNEKLSLLRAQEVKRYLVNDCGIAEQRLQAIGVGESAPYNTSNPRADENRRVEFQALG